MVWTSDAVTSHVSSRLELTSTSPRGLSIETASWYLTGLCLRLSDNGIYEVERLIYTTDTQVQQELDG